MTVQEVAEKLDLEVLTAGAGLEREVSGGYAGDLLSDVIAHARAGDAWVTLQTHGNVVAVASLKELPAVIHVNGRKPGAGTLEKARAEGVALLCTPLPAFELAGRLYQMGLRGCR